MNRTRHLASRYLLKKTHKSDNNSNVVSLDIFYQEVLNLYMSDNNAVLTSDETSYILNLAEQFNANQPDSQYHIKPDGLLYAVKKLVIRDNKNYSGGVSPEHRMTTRSMTQIQAAQAELDALESESLALEARKLEIRERISKNTRARETSTQLSTEVLQSPPHKTSVTERMADVAGVISLLMGLFCVCIGFMRLYNMLLETTSTGTLTDSLSVVKELVHSITAKLEKPTDTSYFMYLIDSFFGLGTCVFKVARTKLSTLLPEIMATLSNNADRLTLDALQRCRPTDIIKLTGNESDGWTSIITGINTIVRASETTLNANAQLNCVSKNVIILTTAEIQRNLNEINMYINVATSSIDSIQSMLSTGTRLIGSGTFLFLPRLLRGTKYMAKGTKNLVISFCNIPRRMFGKTHKLKQGGKSYRKNKHRKNKNKNKNKKQHH